MISILDADTFIYGQVTPDIFGRFGKVTLHKYTDASQVKAHVGDAQIVISNKVPMNDQTLPNPKNIKLIVVAATGYNNIDLNWASKHGITVCNSRNYSTQSVAEHTVLFLLGAAHRLKEHSFFVDDHQWSESPHFSCHQFPYFNLKGKTLGLVGYGQIGQAVAQMAKALGMKVVVAKIPGRTYSDSSRVPFKDVLSQSDFVSLHCQLSKLTHQIINQDSLAYFKPGASLINMGRGDLIDETAVADALKKNQLGVYAADVMVDEPPQNSSPLFKKSIKNRTLITPHVAWSSIESRQNMMQELYQNIEGFLKNKPRNVVNS